MKEVDAAYFVFDEKDLADLENYQSRKGFQHCLWVPFDSIPTMNLIFQSEGKNFYIPQVDDERSCSAITEEIYQETQKFLKALLLEDGFAEGQEEGFPLEYFWFGVWVALYRITFFCQGVLKHASVQKIIMVRRSGYVNYGGLLINKASFVDIAEAFCKNRGIPVEIIAKNELPKKPRTIFYSYGRAWKKSFKRVIAFIQWKRVARKNMNHDYLLVNPAYDNVIHYSAFLTNRPSSGIPQIFSGSQIPFLHSFMRMLYFAIRKFIFSFKKHNDHTGIMDSYKTVILDLEYDVMSFLKETVARYLHDIQWMKAYMSLFWRCCLDQDKKYSAIFSLPSVHLDSYYLIQHVRKSGGKIAVWQHGGFYGYTDHFLQYISDYKNADYFLSVGKGNEKGVGPQGVRRASTVVVGTRALFCEQSYQGPQQQLKQKTTKPQGLFVPVVVGALHSQSRIKWNPGSQFMAMKDIIDYFGLHDRGKLFIKGFRSHKPHEALKEYIEREGFGTVSYTQKAFLDVLSDDFHYVILDNPSTPLLQTLVNYKGVVFLMVNQESWAFREDALALLKKRAIFSSSVAELKQQLTDFFENSDVKGTDEQDTSFIDTYGKPFCYSDYEEFLEKTF